MPPVAEPPPPKRRGNGLAASTFVALADLDPRLGEHVLDLLRLADIPAYLEPAGSTLPSAGGPRDRLFVAAGMRDDALTVVTAAADEAGGSVVYSGRPPERTPAKDDPLAGIDTDAEFAALIANWDQETPDALPELQLRRIDATAEKPPVNPTEPDDEDHYEPPPPPPLPRLSPPTIGAVVLIIVGIGVIGWAGLIGLTTDLGFPLGVVLILTGAGLLISRLRDGNNEDDDPDDDGAVL